MKTSVGSRGLKFPTALQPALNQYKLLHSASVDENFTPFGLIFSQAEELLRFPTAKAIASACEFIFSVLFFAGGRVTPLPNSQSHNFRLRFHLFGLIFRRRKSSPASQQPKP